MKKESIGFMLGLFVLFGGYIAINQYYIQKQQLEIDAFQKKSQATQAKSGETSLQPQAIAPSAAVAPAEQIPASNTSVANSVPSPLVVANPSDLIIKKDYATFEFTPVGGCLGNNVIAGAQKTYVDPSPVSVIENYHSCKAFGFRVGTFDLRNEPAGITKTAQGDLQIVQRVNGLEIIRTFKFAEQNYTGEMQVLVKNTSQNAQSTSVDFEIGATSDNQNSGGMLSSTLPQYHSVAVRLPDGTVKREYTPYETKVGQEQILTEAGSFLTWVTADSLYWMNTVIPQNQIPIAFEVVRTASSFQTVNPDYAQRVYEAWVKQPVNLAPGQALAFNYKLYIGPKNETILKHFDQYHLTDAIDYGFFKIIARPMYHLINFIHSLVHNWGIAIIILTILINIVFLPLQIKGYLSAQKMQKIQPQMKALQEKFKEDKQALQRETMALMSKSGVNPVSGCLPLLPQIPVFFALDSCLRHTFELRQSPFFFWIKDLTIHDPYFILPILMAVLMLGYQKMIPMPSMDPTQAKMMKILPLVFSVFMVFYPSGLAIYVITNTVISMIRQAFLTHRYKNALEK